MDAVHTIAEIESLERIFVLPDTRPLSAIDLLAANRRHDDTHAHSPWLLQRYGVCSRSESPIIQNLSARLGKKGGWARSGVFGQNPVLSQSRPRRLKLESDADGLIVAL